MYLNVFVLNEKNYIWYRHKQTVFSKKGDNLHFSNLPIKKNVLVLIGSPFFPSKEFTSLIISFQNINALIKNKAELSMAKYLKQKGYICESNQIPILCTDSQGLLDVGFLDGFYTLMLWDNHIG